MTVQGGGGGAQTKVSFSGGTVWAVNKTLSSRGSERWQETLYFLPVGQFLAIGIRAVVLTCPLGTAGCFVSEVTKLELPFCSRCRLWSTRGSERALFEGFCTSFVTSALCEPRKPKNLGRVPELGSTMLRGVLRIQSSWRNELMVKSTQAGFPEALSGGSQPPVT